VSVHKVDYFVFPAEAGIQNRLKSLDSRFHGNDAKAIYKQTLINWPLDAPPGKGSVISLSGKESSVLPKPSRTLNALAKLFILSPTRAISSGLKLRPVTASIKAAVFLIAVGARAMSKMKTHSVGQSQVAVLTSWFHLVSLPFPSMLNLSTG